MKLLENNESFYQDTFCCNTHRCNQQILLSGLGIRCYTCDSRITGLDGCSILNTSNSHVYQSESSSRSESCAVSNHRQTKFVFF